LSVFERYLTLWVALCIVAGIALGEVMPGLFAVLSAIEYAKVNLVVAVLIWAMVYPMMVAVDFASLGHVADQPRGLLITLVVNWLVKPFTMAALGVVFFQHVFAGFIAPADAESYIAGLILLGAAPCTAMVFVWSQLTRGDANYTLVQVSVNDLIMVFAFAPIVALLLGVTNIPVPWETLLLSVVLYVVVPLAYTFQPVWNSACPGMANFNVTSYADVAKPELKGKTIASDITKSLTYTNTVISLKENNAFDVSKMWKDLKTTEPIVEFRTEPKMQMVITCQRPFDMWNLSGRVYQNVINKPELAKTLKVGSYKEGQVMLGNQAAVIKGAPHPNAGKLLIDYILSVEGQTVLKQGHHIPASSKVEPEMRDLKGGFRVNYISPAQGVAQTEKALQVYRQMFNEEP